MKKYAVMGMALTLCSMSFGQEYLGFSLGRSSATGACPVSGAPCSKSALAGKVMLGGTVDVPALHTIGVSGYEFSYIRFGRTKTRFTQLLDQQNANAVAGAPGYSLAYGDYDLHGQTNAMTAAMVWRASILATTSLVGKLGLAYVTTSLNASVNGAHIGQGTASKLKPYVGLGIEQQILPATTMSAGLDWTRYSLQGYAGPIRMVGIGLQQAF
ncbi:MAG TPA: hypothetical protein VFM33_02805 [Aquabacterium sp.]|nr:hypothetical protein [Aquabacterium sp.]